MTPRTLSHQAPVSMELSRQEYCSGLLFPSPNIPENSPFKVYNQWFLVYSQSGATSPLISEHFHHSKETHIHERSRIARHPPHPLHPPSPQPRPATTLLLCVLPDLPVWTRGLLGSILPAGPHPAPLFFHLPRY